MPETGDRDDLLARLAAALPPWFGPHGVIGPVLRLPLEMAASVGAWLHAQVAYVRAQTRIRTATGGFLDLAALDFFGPRMRRRKGQTDDAFRARILAELFRPRATRPAMARLLRELTGNEPRIFEPARPADTGGIGVPGGLAIGVSGAIGSIGLPGMAFVDIYRSPDAGIPFAAGIGTPAGGIGVASRLVIASLDQITGALTDEDILAAVNATRPAGITVWVRFGHATVPVSGPSSGPVVSPIPAPTPDPGSGSGSDPGSVFPARSGNGALREAGDALAASGSVTGVAVPTGAYLTATSAHGAVVVESQDGATLNLRLVRPVYPYTPVVDLHLRNTGAQPSKQPYWGADPLDFLATQGAGAGQLAVDRGLTSEDDGTFTTSIWQELDNGTVLTLTVNLSVAPTATGPVPGPTPPPTSPPALFDDFAPRRGAGALYVTFGNVVDDGTGHLLVPAGTSAMMPVSPTQANDGAWGLGNGLFEFRARFTGTSIGPALILWPASDVWPGPEVDLGEFGPDGKMYYSVHWKDPGTGANQSTEYPLPDGHDPAVFHTYAAALVNDRIVLLLDGAAIATNTAHPAPDFANGGENHAMGVLTGAPGNDVVLDSVRWTPEAAMRAEGLVPGLGPLPEGEPPEPLDLSFGSGPDSIVLHVAQDRYLADAQYTIAVDGVGFGGTLTASATMASGGHDTITLRGTWPDGPHTLAVNFLNDAYGGTAATDRNLYVLSAVFTDASPAATRTIVSSTVSMLSAGPVSWGFTAGSAPPVTPPSAGRIEFGVWPQGDYAYVLAWEAWAGRRVDFVHVFTAGWNGWTGLSPEWTVGYYANGNGLGPGPDYRRAFWSGMFVPDYENQGYDAWASVWQEVADGVHDLKFQAWADYIVRISPNDGKPIYWRTTWEVDGEWFPWSHMAKNYTSLFKAAWRRFASVMKARQPRIRMVYDAISSRGDPRLYYPGDDVVDVVSSDTYWGRQYQGSDPAAAFAYTRQNYTYGLDWLAGWCAEIGKPMAWAEWGVSGDDSGPWLDAARTYLLGHNYAFISFWLTPDGMAYDPDFFPDGRYPTAGPHMIALQTALQTSA